MEPSRDTAGRRRRALLARSHELDASLGPDESEIVYSFEDGWTVRYVERREDQLREGHLMRSCLRTIKDGAPLDPNCYSLRDPDNLPHLSFATWSLDRGDNLSRIPRGTLTYEGQNPVRFIFGARAILLVDLARSRILKTEHRRRLLEFAASDAADEAEEFPHTTHGRLRVIAPALAPALDRDMFLELGL